MEAGLKDFAAGVEQLVDKVVSGDLGGEMVTHMDSFVSGFIRHFEHNYSKFEAAVKQTFRLPRRVPPPRRAKASPSWLCCLVHHEMQHRCSPKVVALSFTTSAAHVNMSMKLACSFVHQSNDPPGSKL